MPTLRERAYFSYLKRSKLPILVGPWRSEIGFESLYWLPWLNWVRKAYQLPKERLIAITRGGAGAWYDMGQSVDLYDYVPMANVRKAMLKDAKQHASIKQYRVTDWERKLIPLIAEDLGLRRYHVLHPRWMYRGLQPYWDGKQTAETVLAPLHFDAPPVPHLPLTLQLPEDFVAVRFYVRSTLQFTEENQQFVHTIIQQLTRKVPVVVLETPYHTDDHLDFPIEASDKVIKLTDHYTPTNNLGLQSAVIAKSKAFVGTYGGTMQLAVRLKKPSMGFYRSFEGTAYAHKDLTLRLATLQGTPCFIGTPSEAQLVHEVVA